MEAEGDAPPEGLAVPPFEEGEEVQYIKRGVSVFVDARSLPDPLLLQPCAPRFLLSRGNMLV